LRFAFSLMATSDSAPASELRALVTLAWVEGGALPRPPTLEWRALERYPL